MSEEKEQAPDKQSELKEKLKQMGVMQDENAPPRQKASFISRYKAPIILVAVIAIVLFWWASATNDEQQEVAEAPQTAIPGMMGNPYAPPMPPPPGYMQGDESAARGAPTHPDWGTPPPDWNAPDTRAGDMYGPPPGPPAPRYGYGRPYGYGYYPPPPPPAFYGPYGPYRPYGPPPGYRPPWMNGNYPPAPQAGESAN